MFCLWTAYNFMQKITLPTITTFLQLSLLLPPAAALHSYLCKSNQALTSSWLMIIISMIFFNAYTFDIASRNLSDTIQQTSWMLFALLQSQSFSGSIHFAALGLVSVINPSQLIFIMLGIKSADTKRKLSWLFAGIIVGSMILIATGIDSKYYIDLYFPETMQPQFNLQWMLYACTFTRFIRLYQILFTMIPFLAAFLIRSLNFPSKLQLVLLIFFRLYSSYKCSQFSLVANIVLCVLLMKQYISGLIKLCENRAQQRKTITVKTLTMIAVIVNITFFPLNKMLLNRYLNGFTVNFGFVFLFGSIFWGVNAIFLTQISILQNQLKQKEQEIGVQNSKQD